MFAVKWMVRSGEGNGYLVNNWMKYMRWFQHEFPKESDKLFKNKGLAQRAINRIKRLDWTEYSRDTFEIIEVE